MCVGGPRAVWSPALLSRYSECRRFGFAVPQCQSERFFPQDGVKSALTNCAPGSLNALRVVRGGQRRNTYERTRVLAASSKDDSTQRAYAQGTLCRCAKIAPTNSVSLPCKGVPVPLSWPKWICANRLAGPHEELDARCVHINPVSQGNAEGGTHAQAHKRTREPSNA